jgi:hypothetical protein
MHLRAFTDEEEDLLCSHITFKDLSQGYLFTNDDFRMEAMAFYCDLHPDDYKADHHFSCSDGFITDFKHRHRFSVRSFHDKRRPTVTEEEQQFWTSRLSALLQSSDLDRVVNADETNGLLYPKGLLTWAPTGSTSVQVNIPGNEKESLTVMATVTASGIKLPLQILAQGTTDRVHQSQVGPRG